MEINKPISIQQAVRDKMAEFDLTEKELCDLLGFPFNLGSRAGKLNIFKEGAEVKLSHIVLLSSLFKTDYDYWINIQINYQLYTLAGDDDFCAFADKLERLNLKDES